MSIKTNNPVMKTDRTAKADASYLNGDYGGFAEVLSSERRCNFVFCRRGHPLLSLRFRVPLASRRGRWFAGTTVVSQSGFIYLNQLNFFGAR